MLRSKKEVDRHVKEIFGKMSSDTDVNRNLKGYNIARLYFNIKEYGSAKRYLAEFLSVRMTSPEGHKLLGQIYEAQNEKRKAIQSYKTSYEIMSSQKDLVLKICDLYADVEEDIDVVMHWIEIAEKLYPQHESIASFKRLILTKNNGQAKEELEKLYLASCKERNKRMPTRTGTSTNNQSEKLNWQVAASEGASEDEYICDYDDSPSFNLGHINNAQLMHQSIPRHSSTPYRDLKTPHSRHHREVRLTPERLDAQVKLLLDMQQKTVKALEDQNAQVKTQSEIILSMSQSRVEDLKESLGYYRNLVQEEQSSSNHISSLQPHITALENMMKDLQVEVRAIATEVSELRALRRDDIEEKYKREEPSESQVPLDVTNSAVPNALSTYLNYYGHPPAVPGALLASGLFAGAVPPFASSVPPFAPPVSQPAASYPVAGHGLKQQMSPATVYPHMKMAAHQMVSTTIPLPSSMRTALPQPVACVPPASSTATHPFQIPMPQYMYPYNTPGAMESQKMSEFATKDLLSDIPSISSTVKKGRSPVRGNDLGLTWHKDSTIYMTPSVAHKDDKLSELLLVNKQSSSDGKYESNDEIEEYQPDVTFKPVIEMPELVEEKTGEEKEVAMFCERAKLYRYEATGSEWKQKGVGELKILKSENSQQTRIVMHRDQTKKICANHLITPTMKLIKQGEENIYIWVANDFADEEIKMEKLSARFKTVTVANNFKKEFDDAVLLASESLAVPMIGTISATNAITCSSISLKPITSMVDTVEPVETCTTTSIFGGGFSVNAIAASGSQFSFGLGKTTDSDVNSEKTKPLSLFGNFSAASIGTSDGGFSFGVKPDISKETATSRLFFNDSARNAVPGDDNDESHYESVDDYEPNVEFTPVISMPQLVEVKTGEENEATTFCERAKLYRYDRTSKELKQRGVGDIKILNNIITGKFRIVMRRDQTYKMCANHAITEGMKLTPLEKSDNCWIWNANDYADEEMKTEQLCARFPSTEIANNFKKEFEAAVRYASENSAAHKNEAVVVSDIVSSITLEPLITMLDKVEPTVTTSSIYGGFSVDSIATSGSQFTFGLEATEGNVHSTETVKPNLSIFGNFSASITTSDLAFSFGVKPDSSEGTTKSSNPPKLFFNDSNKNAENDDDESHDESVEEYEPNVQFTPVISMPQLVEIKSGEENEKIIFCERAKLYRYERTSKDLKERGVGDLKILKNLITGKFRIIMRRDQTHKMCANHAITKDMKLTSMSKAEKCWLWNANDFVDEEMKVEQLCARFKTKEIADDFKINFETAVHILGTTVNPAVTPPKNEPNIIFKTPTSSVSNFTSLSTPFSSNSSITTPAGLGTPKGGTTDDTIFMTPCIFGGNYIPKVDGVSSTFKTTTDGSVSTPLNVSAFASTAVISKPSNFGSTPPHNSSFSTTVFSTPVTTSSIFSGLSPNLFNGGSTPGNGVKVPSSFRFNSSGLSGKQNFQSFGNIASFQKNTVTVDEAAFKPHALIFGSSSKDEGGDDSYEPIINFKPVIELPKLVDTKTGEESQEQMFCSRAKLYRFDDKQWKERGTGDVKILKDTATGMVRVIMRREIIHKICANHSITPDMKLNTFTMAENAWIWVAQDFADEEMKMEKFAIKFKSPELSSEFEKQFNNAIDYVSKSKSNQTHEPVQNISKLNSKTSTEDEVTLLFEKKATPEQVAKAREFLLPDNFYLYEDLPNCDGCIGCFAEGMAGQDPRAEFYTDTWGASIDESQGKSFG